MHLRVVDGSGSVPGLARSLLRFVGLALSILLLFVGFLPALSTAGGEPSRTSSPAPSSSTTSTAAASVDEPLHGDLDPDDSGRRRDRCGPFTPG